MGNDFCQRKLPEKDETVSINANIKVWHEHVVHSTKPFVPEESVGHPNLRYKIILKTLNIQICE